MPHITAASASTLAKILAVLRGQGRAQRHGMPRWAVTHARQAEEVRRGSGPAAG